MKTILFVAGGIETVPGIRRAREMGLHTVVSDGSPHAPGFEAAHDGFVANTYGVADTVTAALHYHERIRPLDGVIALGSDVPVTVAAVAEKLGLPGISMASARLAADKLAMKERFAERGVAIPWFAAVESVEHLAEIAREHGLDLVLKPVDSRGARGVLRLGAVVDLAWAFQHAEGQSPTGRVMVEQYLLGPQVSTESLVMDGIAHTVGFSDRNYDRLEQFAPHIIEDGGQMPTVQGSEVRREIADLIQLAAAALGIETGVVKGDIVVSRGRPYVIEIAARLSGGYFCTHQIPLSTGVDFVGAAIRQSVGEAVAPADLVPRHHRGVAQRYFFPSPGRVVRVFAPPVEAEVALLELRVREGDVVGPMLGHPSRAGVVIATGESRAAAVETAEKVVREVGIEVA